jgi:hypothetical protein
LGVIHQQEKLLQSGPTYYFPRMDKVKAFQTFCITSEAPGDVVVKELLKYRLCNIVTFVYGVGSETNTKQRTVIPFLETIVCPFLSITLADCLKGDWPKVIKTATTSMQSADSRYIFLNTTTVDDRLSACYQAICHTVGNIHRAKIIQNFSASFSECVYCILHIFLS